MRPKTPARWAKGETITAARLNEMLDLTMRGDLTTSQGSPLILQQDSRGTLIDLDMTAFGFLAVANGNIPARSGSAAGVGSVFQVFTTPSFTSGQISSMALSTGTIPIKVYNPSSTTMTSTNGIDSGQYCWVQLDNSGLYLVTPLECS